jgi:hypothetical protein
MPAAHSRRDSSFTAGINPAARSSSTDRAIPWSPPARPASNHNPPGPAVAFRPRPARLPIGVPPGRRAKTPSPVPMVIPDPHFGERKSGDSKKTLPPSPPRSAKAPRQPRVPSKAARDPPARPPVPDQCGCHGLRSPTAALAGRWAATGGSGEQAGIRGRRGWSAANGSPGGPLAMGVRGARRPQRWGEKERRPTRRPAVCVRSCLLSEGQTALSRPSLFLFPCRSVLRCSRPRW